jgi:two-component system sensor histidine kinase DegS
MRNIETLKSQTGIDIRLTVTGLEQRLESYLEVMIFRAVQELVGNAIKHSGATNIKVQIDSTETDVRVNVDDNGKGFDVSLIEEGSGMGLKVIRDRVEMLSGRLEVDSVAGQGSRISFQIPAAQSKVFA